MALLLIRPEYDIWSPAEHNGTFRGNQLAFVSAAAALDVLESENILPETVRKGKIAQDFFEKEIRPIDVRLVYKGLGLAAGVDYLALDPDGSLSKKVQTACFEQGLIIERVGRFNAVLKILPPLNIPDDLLVRGMEILRDATRSVLKG